MIPEIVRQLISKKGPLFQTSDGAILDVESQLEQTHDPADSPRTFIIVGRKESVLDFMTPKRTYSVSAEDVEELCWHKDVRRTRALTFKEGEKNFLGLQVETKVT